MKKPIKLLLILSLISIILSSCTSEDGAYINVQKKFPKNKTIFRNGYEFIVVDSNESVYFIKCLSLLNDNITFESKIK